jgi:hypothetical protein
VPRAQRFVLQFLVAVVAEDLGLLPDNLVTDVLRDCVARPADSFDLFSRLFSRMAAEQPARGGRFVEVRYFDGGFFSVVDPIELRHAEALASTPRRIATIGAR